MIKELDIYLTLVTYIVNIWKNYGHPSNDSQADYRKIEQIIYNKQPFQTNLPYIDQEESRLNIKQIVISFQHQNGIALEGATRQEKTSLEKKNAIQTISEVLIRLDDQVDSANQAIRINNQLIQQSKDFISQKIKDDTTYQTECKNALRTITTTLEDKNKQYKEIIQSTQIVIDDIEQILKDHIQQP